MLKLVESGSAPLVAKSKKLLSGPFATLGKKNNNGRVYPRAIYEEAYSEIVPKIQSGSLLGECDHPLNYDEVRLSNVSHVIKECSIGRDGVVSGVVEVLDTPSGKIIQSLIEAGVPIGISSRGLGDTKRTLDGDEVTKFKLITFDLVAEPSFSEAVLSETQRRDLEESLKEIESGFPLRESRYTAGDSTVKATIKRIRESLLTKTNRQSEFNINDIELTAVRKLAETNELLLKKRAEHLRRLTQEVRTLKSEAATLKESLTKRTSVLTSLKSNMSRLQDEYNRVSENTIPKSDLEQIRQQLVETRKQLEVEKRGMSYSQVGRILEGLETSEEISAKLDTLITRRQREVVGDSVQSLRESIAAPKKTKLSGIVSSV